MPACVSSGQQTLALGTQQERKAGCLGFSGPQPSRQDSVVGKCMASGGTVSAGRQAGLCSAANALFWGSRFPICLWMPRLLGCPSYGKGDCSVTMGREPR